MAHSPKRRRHQVQAKSPKAGRSRIVQAKALTQQSAHQVQDDEGLLDQRLPPSTSSATRKPPFISKAAPSAFRYGVPQSSSSTSSKPLPPDPFERTDAPPRPDSPNQTNTFTLKNHNLRFHRRTGRDSVAQKIPIEHHLRAIDQLSKGGGAVPQPIEESSTRPFFSRARSKSRDRNGKPSARDKSRERAKSPPKLKISEPFNPTTTLSTHQAHAKAVPMVRSNPTQPMATSTAAPSKLPRATSAMNFSSLFKPSTYRHKKVVNKVRDAISDRLHLIDESERSHTGPSDRLLDSRNESRGCHTPDEELPPFLQEDRAQRAIESSPKLQQFFGTAGSPGTPRKHSPLADPKVSPSAARRRSMYAISVLEEDALYSDDEDDQILPGLSKLQVTGEGTGLGIVSSKDQGLVAPWTRGLVEGNRGMSISITDLSTMAGILSHEARGQRTRSFVMPESKAAIEAMRRSKPLATPLPKHMQELAKQEPAELFNPFVSGLLQHPDVMTFVDAPVANTKGDKPDLMPETIHPPKGILKQPLPSTQDLETPPRGHKPDTVMPQIPRIHIKRASSASKRSSSDAELCVSSPAFKKKGRLSDPTLGSVPGLPEQDIGDMEIGNQMFHTLDEEYGTQAPSSSTPDPVSATPEPASATSSFNAPTTTSSSTDQLSMRHFLSTTSPSRPNSLLKSRPNSESSIYFEAADGSFEYASTGSGADAVTTANSNPDSPPRRPARPPRSPPLYPRRGSVARSSQLTGAWPSGIPYYPHTNFSKPWTGRSQRVTPSQNIAAAAGSFDFGTSPNASPQTSPELGTPTPRFTAAQKQKGRKHYATGPGLSSKTTLTSKVPSKHTGRSVSESATTLMPPTSPKSPKEEKAEKRKERWYMGEPKMEVGSEDCEGVGCEDDVKHAWRVSRVGNAL